MDYGLKVRFHLMFQLFLNLLFYSSRWCECIFPNLVFLLQIIEAIKNLNQIQLRSCLTKIKLILKDITWCTILLRWVFAINQANGIYSLLNIFTVQKLFCGVNTFFVCCILRVIFQLSTRDVFVTKFA